MPGKGDFTPEELGILLPLFATTAKDNLERVRQALGHLQVEPEDPATYEGLHRAIHSMKGAALQLGLLPIGTLAKAMEGVVKITENGGVILPPAACALLAEAADQLERDVSDLEHSEGTADGPTELIRRLDAMAAQVADEARRRLDAEEQAG